MWQCSTSSGLIELMHDIMGSFVLLNLYNNMFGVFLVLVQAVQAMVQQAMQYIDQTPDLDTKIELIKTLNSVSAGKVSAFSFLMKASLQSVSLSY